MGREWGNFNGNQRETVNHAEDESFALSGMELKACPAHTLTEQARYISNCLAPSPLCMEQFLNW